MKLIEVPLDKLNDKPENNHARGQIYPHEVESLKQAIAQEGLFQPVVVTQEADGTYKLVAGFRRTMACRLLGHKTIPAVYREACTEMQALVLNISENVNRAQLNKLQEAKAVGKIMMMDPTLNEFDIAKRLGQSRGWVQIRKYILELPEEIHEDIAKDMLAIEHIRTCWQLPTREQKFEFVKRVKEKKFRGEKIKIEDLKAEVLKKPLKKKVQERSRIFFVQALIREHLGNNLTTRALGWAAGEVSDIEFMNDIRIYCEKEAVPFTMPVLPQEE